MSRPRRCDLAIVGGGTAGLVAAFVAAALSARVCLVERVATGGDCLWTGCVPSKSLIAAASSWPPFHETPHTLTSPKACSVSPSPTRR